jgi:hypothetical protein
MTRKLFYIFLILVVATCVLLIGTKRTRFFYTAGDKTENAGSPTTQSVIHQQSVVPAVSSKPTEIPARSQFVQPNMESLSNAVRNWSEKVHGQIQFYGKVVDENNLPVENADVEFVWSHFSPLPEGTPHTNTLSNHDGLFSLGGVVGNTLDVSVGKQGYYSVGRSDQNRYNYSSLPGLIPFQPDPNNPVIFQLKKKGAGVRLVTSKHGMSPYFNVAPPSDGTPIFVDFLQRTTGASGNLQIQCWLETDQATHRTKSWKLRLYMPDGGFVAENDPFPFEAPDNGYLPELFFPIPDVSGNSQLGISQKTYYMAFGNPRLYGQIEINASSQTGEVWFQYSVNPDGSRNLEPK